MENQVILSELSLEETNEINAGESLWYWIAYNVSNTLHHPGNADTSMYSNGSVLI